MIIIIFESNLVTFKLRSSNMPPAMAAKEEPPICHTQPPLLILLITFLAMQLMGSLTPSLIFCKKNVKF